MSNDILKNLMLNSISLNCICDKCSYIGDCGYYEETIKPILDGAKTMLFDDEFTIRIKEALNDFECEYFKKGV